jgi:hypothetical protein
MFGHGCESHFNVKKNLLPEENQARGAGGVFVLLQLRSVVVSGTINGLNLRKTQRALLDRMPESPRTGEWAAWSVPLGRTA